MDISLAELFNNRAAADGLVCIAEHVSCVGPVYWCNKDTALFLPDTCIMLHTHPGLLWCGVALQTMIRVICMVWFALGPHQLSYVFLLLCHFIHKILCGDG